MKKLNELLQAQLLLMANTGMLFRTRDSGLDIWEAYLEGFGADPIFRDPTTGKHNCNLCNNFIRRYGNVVAIGEDNQIMTLFDVTIDEEYQASMDKMHKLVASSTVSNVFFETFDELQNLPYEKVKRTAESFKLGTDVNYKTYTEAEAAVYGGVTAGKVYTFNHFSLQLPKAFVDMTGSSIESISAKHRDAKEVFKRAMEEIPLATLELVRDLVAQGSLLNGEAHAYKIDQIIPLKKEYDSLASLGANSRDNWCWKASRDLPFAKFKNELIGVLCSELAEGEDLNKACQSWNKRVDPANYMKAVAPITESQKRMAQEFVEENGYIESFDRRHATIGDIGVAEIEHINTGDDKIKSVSLFDGVKTKKSQHKRNQFEGVETVTIDNFMEKILPNCTSIEAFVENRHEGNFVNMTTANVKGSKKAFKWDNNYSWTYKGNLAGKSQIKEAVKSRGGKVDGVARFSMHFPNTTNDYDLHMIEPSGGHISFNTALRSPIRSSGVLDLDAQGVDGHQSAEKRVENIVYTNKSKMPKGNYKLYVNNYSSGGLRTNFSIEIEIEDQVTLLEFRGNTSKNRLDIATIKFDGSNFEVVPTEDMNIISSLTVSKEIYGIETNNFHKVNLVCLSPNHWGNNRSGNKHYFFMIDGCKSDSSIRSFHSENLNPELAAHRRVLEILGAVNTLEPATDQLAGIGFNATVKDEVILKLGGNFKRTIKVTF